MAIGEISGQYWYTGKGPVDAKQLVKTYEDLLTWDTWQSQSGSKNAYNGMFVAVWLDRDDDKNLTDKNGLYFLFDPDCTSTLKNPDVTNEANWHKFCSIDDIKDIEDNLSSISGKINTLSDRVAALEANKEQLTFAEYDQLPSVGKQNILYIVLDRKLTYIYDANEGYVPLNGGGSSDIEIDMIDGGSAAD